MELTEPAVGWLGQEELTASSRSRTGRWPVAALVAIACLLTIPVWIAAMPAMPDYPAHLASFYLIAGGAKSPLLGAFYRVQWAFVPNLAAELIVPPLASVLGLGGATELFLALTLVLWVVGAGAIQWALYRRMSVAPLFASIFAYNANFMWGFFNYCFAVGLALVAFAGWIALGSRKGALQLVSFALAVLAINFCHLFAAALLLLLIACYEIGEWPMSLREMLHRARAVAALSAPTALAFVLLRPTGGGGPITFNLVDTVLDRLGAAIQFAFDEPAWPFLAALFVFLAAAAWRRKVSFHPRLVLALAVLLLVTVFAPEWAMGGWGVELRLPSVFCVLVLASADFRVEARTECVLAMIAVAVSVFSAATLSGNWLYYARRFAEFRTAAHAIKPGSKIVTVLDGDSIGLASDQPYWHMAEYAIIDRQGFTPLLFTTRGQHVIRLQPAVAAIAAGSAQQGSPPDISELDDLAAGNRNDDKDIREVFPYLIRFQCHYNYAVVVHLGGQRSKVPDMLQLQHAGSFFSLYRILPDEYCARPR